MSLRQESYVRHVDTDTGQDTIHQMIMGKRKKADNIRLDYATGKE